MRVAVGFSVHTGWAAAVVVARPLALLDRVRLELIDRELRFVYHIAAEAGGAAAERRVREAERMARERTAAALRPLVDKHGITVAAVPRPKRALPPLDAILAAHPLIHTAEGELYRAAIADACRAVGLAVVLGAAVAELDLEKPGPPWGKDQRDAAGMAWSALAAR